MIDRAELEAMRQRAAAAQPAVQAVVLRRGEGLYAGLPYDDPVGLLEAAAGSAQDALELVAECERLAPASYVYGREECAEGSCDHVDQLGAECPHVEYRVATFDDVKRAEHLGRLAKALRRAAEAAQRGGGIDDRDMARIVVETVDDTLEAMEAAESGGWAH